ncbi:MAG TPA: phosphatidylserine decarboxylase family protein [Puia sp.]|jgi:phosphatidylserine decarboxylase
MTIHKEGYKTIALCAIVIAALNLASFYFISTRMPALTWVIFFVTLAFFLFIVSFFRVPVRTLSISEKFIVCPADGKVVVIEEITDVEYFHDRRLQVSIFMSPANVHRNVNPVSGDVVYSQYNKGKYLVAWNPKSSTENERHSVVIKNPRGSLLVKQIAGAVAKRIINYLTPGQKVEQGSEMGFIKFGSRVDVLLPPGISLKVEINQMVKGGVTVMAEW